MPAQKPKSVPLGISLDHHLRSHSAADDALRHLIVDISRATKYISYAIQTTSSGLSGTKNEFGEEQLKLDILSDSLICRSLLESGTVATYISEEQSDVIELEKNGKFSVVFDPLDGSSLVDANFAIGSIFGIYEGNTVIGRKPKEQVASLYVLYGPRTLLVYTVGGGKGVHEFILNDVGEFILLRDFLGIGDDADNYSPGNLRAVVDNAKYANVVAQWMHDQKTLRYSGCMVADIHHILSKGQGIFANIGSPEGKYPLGKLRHAFECGPFAMLVEEAGGIATDGALSILEKTIETIDQRTPLLIGSKNDVRATEKLLA